MEAILGTSWCDWGSEQVASNYAIANSPDPVVLPLPTYSGFGPSELGYWDKISCFHFVGTPSTQHMPGVWPSVPSPNCAQAEATFMAAR